MSEIRKDLGYDKPPVTDPQELLAMRRILANKPPNDPKPDWELSEQTKEIGKQGVVQSRQSLRNANPAWKQAEINRSGIADSRARLEVQRKVNMGEPLSPEETELLNTIHRSQTEY